MKYLNIITKGRTPFNNSFNCISFHKNHFQCIIILKFVASKTFMQKSKTND